MRSRNIKPGFYTNEDLAECSCWARLIFPGLWMMADKNGVLENRPKRIKAQLIPCDSVEIAPLIVLGCHKTAFHLQFNNICLVIGIKRPYL